METIKKRLKVREEVLEKARKWAQGLQFPVTAIVIGSYARCDFNLWSDVDVILVADFKGNPLDRLKNIDFPPGFEVIPLTPNELIRLLDKKNPLAIEALKGIILRDDLNIKTQLEKYKQTLSPK